MLMYVSFFNFIFDVDKLLNDFLNKSKNFVFDVKIFFIFIIIIYIIIGKNY